MASITQTANPAGVSASANVATYTAASIGAAAPDRIIAVVVGSELASTPIASCTIDYGSGDTAMNAGTQGNQGAVYARTFYLAVPTGTTATIKVTFTTNSPTNTQNHIAVYRILDAVYSSTGADQSTDMDATDPLTTGSTTIGTGGVMLAVAAGATDTAGKTWANLGEDIDADAGALRFTTAFSTTAGTATRTCTGTTNGEDGAMSWLIFADNSSPTTALNSPADAATGVSTTPVLDFTGTDADGNDVRYNVQIATSAFTQVSIANLTSGNDTDGDNTATTASVSPAADKLQLLKIVLRNGSSIQPSVLSVVGCGLTWEKVDNVDFDTSASSMRSEELWRAMGSSPSSGTIVITTNENESDIIWSLNEATNADTSGTNGSGAIVQSVTSADQSGADGYLSVTLAAFSNINNATFGAFGFDIGTTGSSTPGTGFTELSDTVSGGGDLNGTAIWRNDNDTTVDITASANTFLGGIAVEIKAATQILTDAVSGTDSGFANPDVGGDTDPFTSGDNIQYTVQSALSNSTVYYWRVRGIDPSGSNSYGAWATARSFTVTAGGGTSVKDLIGGGFIPFAR